MMTLGVKRVGELVIAAGITALLTFGYIVYTGRMLGPVEYADFSAGLSVIYLFGAALSPVTPTVARLVARSMVRDDIPAAKALRREALRHLVVTVAIIGAILAVFSGPIAGALHFRTPSTLLLAFAAALLYTLVSVDRGVVHGLMRFRTHNANTVLEAAIRAGGGALLMHFTRNSAVALASYVVALLVAESAIAIPLSREWRGIPRASVDWQEVLRLTKPMIVLMLAIAILQNSDVLAVKRFFPAADAGVYGAASAIARAFGVIFVPLYVLAGPLLTGAHEAGRPIRGLTLQLCGVFLALSSIPLLLLVLWPARVMTLLYGPAFAAAGPLVARLGGVAIITCTALMLAQALITVADFRFLPAFAIGALTQILTLALIHGNFNDVIGALYATQLAVLLLVAINFFKCSRLSSPEFTSLRIS